MYIFLFDISMLPSSSLILYSFHLLIIFVLFFRVWDRQFLSPDYLECVRSIINSLESWHLSSTDVNKCDKLFSGWQNGRQNVKTHIEVVANIRSTQLKSRIKQQANKFLFLICMLLRPKCDLCGLQPHMRTAWNALCCAPLRYFFFFQMAPRKKTNSSDMFVFVCGRKFHFFSSSTNKIDLIDVVAFNCFRFVFLIKTSSRWTKSTISKMEAILG